MRSGGTGQGVHAGRPSRRRLGAKTLAARALLHGAAGAAEGKAEAVKGILCSWGSDRDSQLLQGERTAGRFFTRQFLDLD